MNDSGHPRRRAAQSATGPSGPSMTSPWRWPAARRSVIWARGFQHSTGPTTDGLVGPQTWQALISATSSG
jgi:peptidoglycan hydrolase-like protein with peptidoglycan-binding domain